MLFPMLKLPAQGVRKDLPRGRIAQLVTALASHAFIASDYDQNPPTTSRQISSSESFRDVCHSLSGACVPGLDHNSCTKPSRESSGRPVCQSGVPIEGLEIAPKKMRCAETVHVSSERGDGNETTAICRSRGNKGMSMVPPRAVRGMQARPMAKPC
jgi:hypothetical protein